MSPNDFADRLSNMYNEGSEFGLFSGDDSLIRDRFGRFLEIDFSKYDKSQGLAALLFDCKLMRYLGVPEELIALWRSAHTVTYLCDRTNKVKLRVIYQRKSGDASTFFGNTTYEQQQQQKYFNNFHK